MVIEGWKDIAKALGVGVRTAQSYAALPADPLPVRVRRTRDRRRWARAEDLAKWAARHDLPTA
jgi:hypothetical protein